MDQDKSQALKAELANQPEPHFVSIERFFEGNDDLGSIGCNLIEHPGIEVFQDVLTGLLERPDVEAVYAQISELDPGEGNWPFTDTVYVAGRISLESLRGAVAPLQPDTVEAVGTFEIPPAILQRHGPPVLAIWWD